MFLHLDMVEAQLLLHLLLLLHLFKILVLVVPELAGSKQLRRLVPLVCALGGPEAPLAFGWQPGKLSPKELEERLDAKRSGTAVPNGQTNGCIGLTAPTDTERAAVTAATRTRADTAAEQPTLLGRAAAAGRRRLTDLAGLTDLTEPADPTDAAWVAITAATRSAPDAAVTMPAAPPAQAL